MLRLVLAYIFELRRTGQGAAKTVLFEARTARHHAQQYAGPAGRNLTELNLPTLRANYICSENNAPIDGTKKRPRMSERALNRWKLKMADVYNSTKMAEGDERNTIQFAFLRFLRSFVNS